MPMGLQVNTGDDGITLEEGVRRFRGKVLEVHSGDDMIVMVDLNMDSLFKKVRVRLHEVDTPDAYRLSSDTQAGKIRDIVKQKVANQDVLIDLYSVRKGGWIATVWYLDKGEKANLNEFLKSLGYIFKES